MINYGHIPTTSDDSGMHRRWCVVRDLPKMQIKSLFALSFTSGALSSNVITTLQQKNHRNSKKRKCKVWKCLQSLFSMQSVWRIWTGHAYV